MTDEYTRATARRAVAKIAEVAGYSAFQESALEALSELLIKSISEIGATSHSYAELAGRTQSNVFDMVSFPIQALLSDPTRSG